MKLYEHEGRIVYIPSKSYGDIIILCPYIDECYKRYRDATCPLVESFHRRMPWRAVSCLRNEKEFLRRISLKARLRYKKLMRSSALQS